MADTFVFQCSDCKCRIRTQVAKAGSDARCPKCRKKIQVPRLDEDSKVCPQCGVLVKASICLNCNYNFTRPWTRKCSVCGKLTSDAVEMCSACKGQQGQRTAEEQSRREDAQQRQHEAEKVGKRRFTFDPKTTSNPEKLVQMLFDEASNELPEVDPEHAAKCVAENPLGAGETLYVGTLEQVRSALRHVITASGSFRKYELRLVEEWLCAEVQIDSTLWSFPIWKGRDNQWFVAGNSHTHFDPQELRDVRLELVDQSSTNAHPVCVEAVRKCKSCGYIERCEHSVNATLPTSLVGDVGQSPPGAAIECSKCMSDTSMLWRAPGGELFTRVILAPTQPPAAGVEPGTPSLRRDAEEMSAAEMSVTDILAAARREVAADQASPTETSDQTRDRDADSATANTEVNEGKGAQASARQRELKQRLMEKHGSVQPEKDELLDDSVSYMYVSGSDRPFANCSDDACPCESPGARIKRGKGFMYVSRQVAEFRRNALTEEKVQEKLNKSHGGRGFTMVGPGVVAPILMCELGAKKRELNLKVAARDARHWWETGQVPCRPTPRKPSPQTRKEPDSEKAQQFLDAGNEQYEAGNLSEAIRKYRDAIAADSTESRSWLHAGLCCLQAVVHFFELEAQSTISNNPPELFIILACNSKQFPGGLIGQQVRDMLVEGDAEKLQHCLEVAERSFKKARELGDQGGALLWLLTLNRSIGRFTDCKQLYQQAAARGDIHSADMDGAKNIQDGIPEFRKGLKWLTEATEGWVVPSGELLQRDQLEKVYDEAVKLRSLLSDEGEPKQAATNASVERATKIDVELFVREGQPIKRRGKGECKCESCGKVFRLGTNAVGITMAEAMSHIYGDGRGRSIFLVAGSESQFANVPDTIDRCDRGSAKAWRGTKSYSEIQKAHLRKTGRSWKCNKCGHIQVYDWDNFGRMPSEFESSGFEWTEGFSGFVIVSLLIVFGAAAMGTLIATFGVDDSDPQAASAKTVDGEAAPQVVPVVRRLEHVIDDIRNVSHSEDARIAAIAEVDVFGVPEDDHCDRLHALLADREDSAEVRSRLASALVEWNVEGEAGRFRSTVKKIASQSDFTDPILVHAIECYESLDPEPDLFPEFLPVVGLESAEPALRVLIIDRLDRVLIKERTGWSDPALVAELRRVAVSESEDFSVRYSIARLLLAKDQRFSFRFFRNVFGESEEPGEFWQAVEQILVNKHMRIWTDSSGKHRRRAVLIDVQDGNAELLRADGTYIQVPLPRFSPQDRKVAEDWLRGDAP